MSQKNKQTTRIVAAVIIVVIIVGAYYFAAPYFSSSSTSQTVTTTAPTSVTRDTLAMVDKFWPTSGPTEGANPLFQPNWPVWGSITVYQPLVAVNLTAEYQDNVVQFLPGLASWTVSSDGTTYTFTLRQNVTFSNGDPLNAYQVWAVMYGYYYLTGNSTTWDQSYPVFDMSAADFGPATIALLTNSGLINPSQAALNIMMNSSWPIYVQDPNTIVFRLKGPFTFFPGTMTTYNGLIWDAQFVLKNGGFGTPTAMNTYFDNHPVPGTGPYTITEVATNAYMKYAQNPTYWGLSLSQAEIQANPWADPGHVKNVIIYYKPDDIDRYTDLSTGAVQVAAIDTPNWNLITQNPDKYAYTNLPAWGGIMTAIALNTQIYPTNITDVRLAIVHALNYTQIGQQGFFGKVSPAVGPEYPGWKDFYDLGNLPPYEYNLTLAKQYLAESGVSVSNMPALSFKTLVSCSWCVTVAQVVQANLAQLGITVNIQVLSIGTYTSAYGSYSSNLANAQNIGNLAFLGSATWAPDALTPVDNWLSFVSKGSVWGNWAIYSNPVVESAISSFFSSTDVSYIQSQLTKAQAQIYQDAPYAWLGVNQLWYGGGSLVWQRGVVNSFYTDQLWDGSDTMPLFNTLTFSS
ncbi:MAG TPA: ABC transporter substrate-binding protein [Candidatus Saccharimonadales bacterium]|nr:ABC transporter substrate-binding protein [Candidatus Saccharimonadales bacterium]